MKVPFFSGLGIAFAVMAGGLFADRSPFMALIAFALAPLFLVWAIRAAMHVMTEDVLAASRELDVMLQGDDGPHRCYQPQTAAEAKQFTAAWCDHCARARHAERCFIRFCAETLETEHPHFPPEWRIGHSGPLCTAYEPGRRVG